MVAVMKIVMISVTVISYDATGRAQPYIPIFIFRKTRD